MRSKTQNNSDQKPQKEIISTFRGNRFTINRPQDWKDKSIYSLNGPIDSGIQHNILITVEYDVEIDSLANLADRQIESLETQLKGCRVLKRGERTLNNGQEAYEAIFRWYPTDEQCLYQKQIYVLFGSTAYALTTTFSKKTRKTRGPEVDRIMMSFKPEELPEDKA